MSTENTTQNEGVSTRDNVKDEVAETVGGESVTGEAANTGVGGEVDRLRADAERFRDMALRGQADFDNYRKRAAREKEEAVKFANLGLVDRFLPILDNFELGLLSARSTEGAAQVVMGFEMVGRQLQDFLTQSGVEVVAGEGSDFDPNLHEAVQQEESLDVPEGRVLRVLRKGYRMKERLVRPAMVVVSKAPAV
jgi:molecular chaperone GrpE